VGVVELVEVIHPHVWKMTFALGDDDGEYFCRVLLASDGLPFVPEAKACYRTSVSSSLSYVGRSDRKMAV